MHHLCVGRKFMPRALACACLVLLFPGPGAADEASPSTRLTTVPEPIQFGFKPVEPGVSFRATESDSERWVPSTHGAVPDSPASTIRPLDPPALATPIGSAGPSGRAEPLPNWVTVGRTPYAARAGALAGAQGPPRGYSQPRSGR